MSAPPGLRLLRHCIWLKIFHQDRARTSFKKQFWELNLGFEPGCLFLTIIQKLKWLQYLGLNLNKEIVQRILEIVK